VQVGSAVAEGPLTPPPLGPPPPPDLPPPPPRELEPEPPPLLLLWQPHAEVTTEIASTIRAVRMNETVRFVKPPRRYQRRRAESCEEANSR
jgi:hypothetical protein